MRAPALAGALAVAAILGACTGPAARIDALANELGLQRHDLTDTPLPHAVFRNAASIGTRRLHVYLEGDGTPWVGNLPAADPTPREPVALRLAAADPAPSLLLGRPCHHGIARDRRCRAALWTDQRYSQEVVDSLAAALGSVIAPDTRITLIGYSGGGVLAMLLAERMPQVDRVVTLAANLDVAAWTAHHRFEPLRGSLDPATRPALRRNVRQWHFAGANDRVVPPSLVQAVVARQADATLQVVGDHDHACCWVRSWTQRLRALVVDVPD